MKRACSFSWKIDRPQGPLTAGPELESPLPAKLRWSRQTDGTVLVRRTPHGENTMHIDLGALQPGHVYGLMTQLLIPRPIAWILSDNGNGEFNLAPFSYFTGISSNPPLLMVAIGKKQDGSDKDTLANVASRDHFTVHIPSTTDQDMVTASAEPLPAQESEVTKLGLELAQMDGCPLPRLRSAQIAMACSKHQIIRLEGVAQAMLVGRVHSVFIADEVAGTNQKGHIKVSALDIDPLCRLGSTEYASLGRTLPS